MKILACIPEAEATRRTSAVARPIARREFLSLAGKAATAGAAALVLPHLGACTKLTLPQKPNFVFILIDDLGWADVGYNGSTFYETPNIDRLAAEGMQFTDAYAACPVCSPTRASILTGKYPARLNLTDWIPGHSLPHARLRVPRFNQQLPLEEVTIAEALAASGYVSASLGKWHLGGEPFYPDQQGFALNFGGTHKGQPPSYFYPHKIPTIPGGKPGEYLTDRLADEALDLIEANRKKPFFLYWSHFAVHTPLQAKAEMIEKYNAKRDPEAAQNNATYAAMIESVDQAVGRVLAKLEELDIADHTVVIFMSDNGGLARVTSNAPLRAGKGSPYEGGVREPMIVRWPGVVEAGSVNHTPVTSTDFFPTILEIAGVKLPPENALDGVSLVPLLQQTGSVNRDALFWHYPHYHPGGATPYSAVRKGDYKLIEFFEDQRLELYNLKNDIGESHDLSGQMPEKIAELHKLLQDWRASVGAQMPSPNPDYDPAREREWSWMRNKKK